MTIKEIINLEMESITVNDMDLIEKVENNLGCGISDGWGSCGHKVE